MYVYRVRHNVRGYHNSSVILWFNPKLIATQTVSTISSTKKTCSITYQKFREIPVGKVTFQMTFIAIFNKIQGFPVLFSLTASS